MTILSRVERRKQEARKRIIETCEQLFIYEKNFTSATMREIARRADVSTGALYLHFKSKEDILATIFYDFLRENFSSLQKRMAGTTTGKAQLSAIFDFLEDMLHEPRVTLYIQIPPIFTRTAVADAPADIWDLLKNTSNEMLAEVTRAFQKAMDEKTIADDCDPALLAVTLLTTYFSLFRLFTTELPVMDSHPIQTYSLDDIFKTFRSTFQKGLFFSVNSGKTPN